MNFRLKMNQTEMLEMRESRDQEKTHRKSPSLISQSLEMNSRVEAKAKTATHSVIYVKEKG